MHHIASALAVKPCQTKTLIQCLGIIHPIGGPDPASGWNVQLEAQAVVTLPHTALSQGAIAVLTRGIQSRFAGSGNLSRAVQRRSLLVSHLAAVASCVWLGLAAKELRIHPRFALATTVPVG
jgi:hypothetical protein